VSFLGLVVLFQLVMFGVLIHASLEAPLPPRAEKVGKPLLTHEGTAAAASFGLGLPQSLSVAAKSTLLTSGANNKMRSMQVHLSDFTGRGMRGDVCAVGDEHGLADHRGNRSKSRKACHRIVMSIVGDNYVHD
jgi:hypothetical protein